VRATGRLPAGESSSIKRAFAALVASGDTAAPYAIAAQSGFSRTNADPNQQRTNAGKGGDNGGDRGGDRGGAVSGGEKQYTPFPRNENGSIKSFPVGGKPCHCGLSHLHPATAPSRRTCGPRTRTASGAGSDETYAPSRACRATPRASRECTTRRDRTLTASPNVRALDRGPRRQKENGHREGVENGVLGG
jgi:hypothetical protein